MKKAFTIAEICLALLVVTFIAMIMLPSLINSSEKQVAQTGLTKAYTQLQDLCHAVGLLEARGQIVVPRNGDIAQSILRDVIFERRQNGANITLTPRILKTVIFDNNNNTFNAYINANANVINRYAPRFSNNNPNNITDMQQKAINNTAAAAGDTVFLKSGIAIFYIGNNRIAVDVNGKKPPNISGRDIFYFDFTTNANSISVEPTHVIGSSCVLGNDTLNCAYQIIYQDNGKITYY